MGSSRASDAELVTLAITGEPEALAVLLERYRPSLYATAIRLLRNRDDALDAVQETCVVALVRLGMLRDPETVAGWLHSVLRNTCLMRLRGDHHERLLQQAEVPAPAPGPEDILEAHALRDWVWTALDALSPDDRLTVMLRYFSRCRSYQAIAAVGQDQPACSDRRRAELTGSAGGTYASDPAQPAPSTYPWTPSSSAAPSATAPIRPACSPPSSPLTLHPGPPQHNELPAWSRSKQRTSAQPRTLSPEATPLRCHAPLPSLGAP